MFRLLLALALLAAPAWAEKHRFSTAVFADVVTFTMPAGFHVDHHIAKPGRYYVFAIPKGQRVGWETALVSLIAYENRTQSERSDNAHLLAMRWVGDYAQDCPGGFRYTALPLPRIAGVSDAKAFFTHCSRDFADTRKESTIVLFLTGQKHMYALEWLQRGDVPERMNYARWYPRLALLARNFRICDQTAGQTALISSCTAN